MKRQERSFLFESFDSAESAFDLFQNSIRSGMNYDSNISDHFLATVLTRPVKVTGNREDISATFEFDSEKSENFSFMVRIEGKNSPHRFLPNPCDIRYTTNSNSRRLVSNLIQQHTKVIMSANSGDIFPEPGSKIIVSLDRNKFGSFKTDIAKSYVEYVEPPPANQNVKIDCSKLKSAFDSGTIMPSPTAGSTYTPVTVSMEEAIELSVQEAVNFGVTNPYAIVGMLAVSAKEANLKPIGETDKFGGYGGTPTERLKEIFNNRKLRKKDRKITCKGKITYPDGTLVTAGDWGALTDDQIASLKKDNQKFFALVYGGDNTNDCEGDGYLYRGRGFNQLTYKSNYKAVGNFIGEDLVANPDLVLEPKIAIKAMFAYYLKTGWGHQNAAWWNALTSYQEASNAAADRTAGKFNATRARANSDKRLQQFINMHKNGELIIPSPSP